MERIVLVRYGEIALKSAPVRRRFTNILIDNIKEILGEIPAEIMTERGRIFIRTSRPEEVAVRVANLPGVVSSSPTWKTNTSIENICGMATKVFRASFPEGGSFAVRVRRTGNHGFTSQDVAEEVGEILLEDNPGMTVDLDSPDHQLHVEIRDDDAYIFTEIIDGTGGLPVWSQGKIVVLFSGDVGGVVSTYLLLKRGALVYPLFLNPGGKEEKKQVFQLAGKLTKFHPELELMVVPFRGVLDKISEEVPQGLRWMMCRWFSLRVGEGLAKKIDAKALATSLDLKRMSSISLDNLRTLEEGVHPPVLYPLLGHDEDGRQEIGRKITGNENLGNNFAPCLNFPQPDGKINLEEIKEVGKDIEAKKSVESVVKSIETKKLGV